MPIFIPVGGDFGPAAEFAGGIMQGVAFHRERARQEQLAREAEQRAQAFRLEEENRRNQFQLMRDRAGRDFEMLTQGNRQAAEQAAAEANRAFQRERDTTRRGYDLQDQETKQAQDLAQGRSLLEAAGVGQPGEDFYLNPNSQPVVPSLGEGGAKALLGYREAQARQAEAAANRQRDDQRAADRLTLEQQRVEAYVQSVKNKGAPPTEEDIAGLADAIQAANPGIPASQAMGFARGRLQYKAPMQIPTETLAQKGQRDVIRGQLGELRSVRRSLMGQKGRDIAKVLGEKFGIPPVPDAKTKDKFNPDVEKITERLDSQISDLESKLDTIGVPQSSGIDEKVKAMSDDELRALVGGQ